ncbi:hypothetical protein EJ05DRAFT_248855 [Pseudovirgaria hyperparasitica]|uniref:Uncharacterized protein n=1 Tax=Pseudovirgaria hyperparasitica TaxID=470096 RepID=A0A6A6WG26_9PEZI|nr:uncharacterized protein EJ05DRAFT_248855 [Pseudovirgaria hyperparasitica]KAF2760990.1 hypothetical protein EJ05DRAFT_248855 [Pseudovirgaria hyperparasitica]
MNEMQVTLGRVSLDDWQICNFISFLWPCCVCALSMAISASICARPRPLCQQNSLPPTRITVLMVVAPGVVAAYVVRTQVRPRNTNGGAQCIASAVCVRDRPGSPRHSKASSRSLYACATAFDIRRMTLQVPKQKKPMHASQQWRYFKTGDIRSIDQRVENSTDCKK